MSPNRGAPTAPIELGGDPADATPRTATPVVEVGPDVVRRLEDACSSVTTDPAELAEASRDWWPLAMVWALDNRLGGKAGAVARPRSTDEVAAVVTVCNEDRVPLTVAAGRSGVSGASVPVFGGVVLDLTGLSGIVDVDPRSLVLDVGTGTFGDVLEEELRGEHGLTLGHWPQSVALSTVGGWLACRGAGQLSNRYGKIEDLVLGLDVVLADGTLVHTGGSPRAAVGPDLNQLFVGSEGTLGVIVGARLRLHPAPTAEQRAAYAFDSFADGLDACRRVVQRGADPAVMRLYDAVEADRSYQTGEASVLLVLDEGDPATVPANMAVVGEECAAADRLDEALVGRWLEHRNDVAILESLISAEWVVDTMEVAGRWGCLPAMYERTVEAISAVEHTRAASAHQSHAYTDGACLYFTFAGKPPPEDRERYYTEVFDAAVAAVLAEGGALSHHHGVGLNRGRFVPEALGPAFDVVVAMKQALDPNGILNPGKLGLPSPFGEVAWP